MKELIKAVEYNIKPILWYIGTIIVCLLIGIAIGVWGIHDVFYPPMTVVDTTTGEWHGVTVRPAIVAASKVPAGVTAQVELTINIPAQHEWAVERGSNGLDSRGSNGIFSGMVRGKDDTTAMDAETSQGDSEGIGFKTYDFKSRGGGWFTTAGEIQFNAWSIPLIIQTLANGDISVLTDEPDITFSVKQAVKVKPKSPPWIRTGISAGYDGKGNLSANGNLLLWQHIPVSAGFRTDNCWQVQAGWLW